MAENLFISSAENKGDKYENLITQLKALIAIEKDLIANLANITAALAQTFGFFWVGFYLVKDGELVLAPFQGPIACTRIKYGKGVCGTAWKEERTIIVADVDEFPGHIACSSQSKSEIVVPVFSNEGVAGVLDVDSNELNDFDEEDKKYLEIVCRLVSLQHFS